MPSPSPTSPAPARADSAGSAGPLNEVLGWFRRLLTADSLPRTLVPSILLGVGLTITPNALLLHGNRFDIAEQGPFIVGFLVAGTVAGLLVLLLSRFIAPHVAGGLVGAFGYGFFSLSWVPNHVGILTLVSFWILTGMVFATIMIWLLSNSRTMVTIAGVAITGLTAVLIGTSLVATGITEVDGSANEIPTALAFSETPEVRPNVYIFVLDGFSNPDTTTTQFAEHDIAFDIDDSIDNLEGLGFERDEHATSNYGQTILSLPSTFNGVYHHTADEPLTLAEVANRGTTAIRGDNALVHSLRAIGYEFWYSDSDVWAPSSCDPQLADRCLGQASGNGESTRAVWGNSPLRWQLGLQSLADLSSPTSVVEEIIEERAVRTSESPYFAFAHIISPHQPYRYEPDCSLRAQGSPGTRLTYGFRPEFRPLYAEQAACLGQDLVSAMDRLIEIDPTALIFIQADHGSEFEAIRDTADWPLAMAQERLSIFRATYLPQECRSSDIAAESVINTAPVIVGCLTGESPTLLEPRYFFTELEATEGRTNEGFDLFDTAANSGE